MMFSLVDSLYCLLIWIVSEGQTIFPNIQFKPCIMSQFFIKLLASWQTNFLANAYFYSMYVYIYEIVKLWVSKRKKLCLGNTSIALERQNCISLTSGWNFIITVWSARVGNTQPLEWLWVSVFVLEDSYTEENPITQHVYKHCTAFTCAGLVDEASGS